MVKGGDTCSTHSVIEGLLNSFGNSGAVEWYCVVSWTILVVKYDRKTDDVHQNGRPFLSYSV